MDNIEKAAVKNATLYISEKETGKRRVAKASFISGAEWMLEEVLSILKDYHNEKFLGNLVLAVRHGKELNGLKGAHIEWTKTENGSAGRIVPEFE